MNKLEFISQVNFDKLSRKLEIRVFDKEVFFLLLLNKFSRVKFVEELK